MRPLLLRVKGLHSFREPQTVDFARLTGAGVFGVFGPTGAGKSTLLDAITLALYGKVDRASSGTQGIINQHETSLEVAFTFELGRERYRVERRYTRVKDSPDAVRSGTCRLLALDGAGEERVLASAAREVGEAVTRMVGLTADDFQRAVVLPQGKFAEFLHLGGTERRRMLQRLFDLERFGEALAERVKQEMATVERALAEAAAEQAGLGDASQDALTAAAAAEAAVRARALAAKRTLEQARRDWDTWSEVGAWQDELAASTAANAAHQAQEPVIAAVRAELEASRRAEALRPFLEAAAQADADRAAAESALAACEAAHQAGQLAFATVAERLQAARRRRQVQEPGLQLRRGQLQEGLRVEADLAVQRAALATAGLARDKRQNESARALKSRVAAQERVDALTAAQARDTAEMAALQVDPERRRAAGRAETALAQLRAAQSRAGRARSELAAARVAAELAAAAAQTAAALQRETAASWEREAARHEQWGDLAAEGARLARLEAAVASFGDACRQTAAAGAEATAAAAAAESAGSAEREANEAAAEADHALSVLQPAVQAVHLARRQAEQAHRAAALAEALQPGEPCPVCGSTEHPRPAMPPAEAFPGTWAALAKGLADVAPGGDLGAIRPGDLNALAEAADAALAVARERSSLQRAGRAAAAAGSSGAAAALRLARTRVEEAGARQAAAARALAADWADLAPDELAAQVAGAAQVFAQRQAEERAWADAASGRRRAADAAAAALPAAESHAAGTAARVDALAEAAREAEATVATALLDLASTGLAEAEVEPAAAALVQADADAARLSAALAGREREIAMAGAELRAALAEVEATAGAMAAAEQAWAAAGDAVAQSERDLQERTGGRPAAQVLAEIDAALADLATGIEAAEQDWARADGARHDAALALAAAREVMAAASARHGDTGRRLAAELARHGFADPDAARAATRTAAERDALEGAIRRHEDEKTRLVADRERLTALLAGRGVDNAALCSYRDALAAEEAAAADALQALGAARKHLGELRAHAERWRVLAEKRAWNERRRDDLADLQAVLRGQEFVEFLAEEELATLAGAASGRLQRLTRGRYALEVDPREGFAIRDDWGGGIRRPVASLSGGETFLTSLALALALSAQVQLRGRYPLEFFFLDEGFGTLDPDALALALDSLERLYDERLVIGVISHLPEIRSRLNRRVVVEPAEPGGAGSRLRIEVA
ncbi:MAG TPA: AAA family ATPase [Bacillota bacterium]|nr:AAA family ATPase [Bacillota bacterium]